MFAFQEKPGVPVMIEEEGFPILLGVTGRAVFAECPLVGIIFPVTGQTSTWGFCLCHRNFVATFAFKPNMFSLQEKLGAAIMIK
jgi:hypothetical protein